MDTLILVILSVFVCVIGCYVWSQVKLSQKLLHNCMVSTDTIHALTKEIIHLSDDHKIPLETLKKVNKILDHHNYLLYKDFD